jgi:hypothetical protein
MNNGNNDCYYDKEENDDGNEGEFYHLVFVFFFCFFVF